jgi:hypothetical protein
MSTARPTRNHKQQLRLRRHRDGSQLRRLTTFKAGKMNLAYNAELAKYECVADEARENVRLVWKEAGLQWYDHWEKLVKDTVRLNNFPETTFERDDVPGKVHETDSVWYLGIRCNGIPY